jgi:hypothetical protein
VRRLLAAALLALALPLPALADYKESYLKAMEAVDRKQWADVAKHMREALAENPREGGKVKLYGTRYETYLPHFYLGVALLNTGDCDGAVKAFASSEEQGAIRGTSKYAELLGGRKTCEAKVAKAPTPPPPTPPPPTPPPTPRPTPPPEATPVPAATPAAKSPGPTPARVTPSPTAVKPASPADLTGAAQAYFAGRYSDAVAALESLNLGRGRRAAQALLLRSAARYALYRIGSEQDASLRSRAVEDAVAARRADPSLMPDEAAFSPAFLKFFREAR